MRKWIAIASACAALAAVAGCGATPPVHAGMDGGRWDGGVWNSVLGYHGPSNATIAGGPSR